MTPAEILRLGWALNSLYPGQPALADGWTMRDRLFIPQDPLPVCLSVGDDRTGTINRLWRGSETDWDWGADFRFLFSPSPFGIGRIEQGFGQYYGGAKTESGRPLEPCDRIIGHSLGGPAATYDGSVGGVPGGAELVLAATPEPGDGDFSGWATPRFKAIYRLENPNDAVPDAPGRIFGYKDLLGSPIVVDMRPLGIDQWDLPGNHHLPNYLRAYAIANGITP